jgi:hypothetical protein
MRPHYKAEHMAAHDQIVKTPKTPCHASAVHTCLCAVPSGGCGWCLRGYGSTHFLSSETLPNSQPSALAVDAMALLDAPIPE